MNNSVLKCTRFPGELTVEAPPELDPTSAAADVEDCFVVGALKKVYCGGSLYEDCFPICINCPYTWCCSGEYLCHVCSVI